MSASGWVTVGMAALRYFGPFGKNDTIPPLKIVCFIAKINDYLQQKND